jgi:glycosyltransferase involved in cell wall biosynthesis
LEHTADRIRRQEARLHGTPLRRRYYVYHGGLRLWEVARSLQLADHAILLNQTDLRIAREELGVAPARSTIVPHGTNSAFFERPIDEHGDGAIRLAFVGSWIERKGIATLVGVMAALADAGLPAQLLLLGTKPEAHVREAFPERVRGAVRIVPSFANATLPEHLAGADILLSMSRTEGFQLTLIEGMAAGLAPLSTSAGAAAEIIEHGRDGMLLPYGDVAAFTGAVIALATDRARLTAMRHAARATAARYRWPDIAARTIDVYQSAIASRRAAGRP